MTLNLQKSNVNNQREREIAKKTTALTKTRTVSPERIFETKGAETKMLTPDSDEEGLETQSALNSLE